jgi:hypothetical protein
VAPYTVEAKEVFATRPQAQSFADARQLSAGVRALFDAMPSYHRAWSNVVGTVYPTDTIRAHVGKTWKAKAPGHTYQGDPSWAPGQPGNLWTLLPNPGAGPWVSGADYPAGSRCTNVGHAYTIVIPHTSQSDWEPQMVPNLWHDDGPASIVEPYNLAWWWVVQNTEPDYTQVERGKEV